jgi:hypothetical protein
LIFGALPDKLVYVWKGFEPPALAPDVESATITVSQCHYTAFPLVFVQNGIRFELWGEPEIEHWAQDNTWYFREEWHGSRN